MARFCRFDLRTTDVDSARAFYASVLAHDRSSVWPLHEQARARGARPHWLGNIGVDDVERVAGALVARGAERLGPTVAMIDGGQRTVLRDPGGAVVAVSSLPKAAVDGGGEVVWHVLNTTDAQRAMRDYGEIFGWVPKDLIDVGEHGTFQLFAWDAASASAGAIGDIAGRPGVHPHWLFFFEVEALDSAMERARTAGGVVVQASTLPSGQRYCVCDDPQGAAFALRQRS